MDKTPEEIAAEKAEQDKKNIADTRKGINVTVSKETEQETEEETEDNEEVVAETEVKEEIKDNKEEIKDSKETVKELKKQQANAETQKEKDKFQRRIDREVAKRKVLETENAELKAKLASQPDKENVLTEEEVEKRAETKAQQKQIQREFEAATDRLFKASVKLDKDFQAKINALADDVGLIPGHLIGILDDLDNGGDILVHFTANHDEAEEIYQMSPAKAAVKLAKLSNKLEAAKKPAPKEISKVPDPVETIKGGAQNPDTLPKDPTKHMDQFVRLRAKQAEERRRAKMGLH
jgi:chromosome segregation ATPase